jgi:hypothetical protein
MTALLSYKSRAEADADRAAQTALLYALRASENGLRRDDCGAWRINGKRGHVFIWGDGQSWVLYVQAGSPRRWCNIKKQLAFCRVTQDGDDEGCLRLFGLPTPEQAKAIRELLGIRKRTVYSPEMLIAKRQGLASTLERSKTPTAEPVPAEKSANASSWPPPPIPAPLSGEIFARNPLSVEEGA